MKITVTGHRPNKLGGYSADVLNRLADFATAELLELCPELVYTGMAQGFDLAVAWACLHLDIPYVACIPFKGQEQIWPEETQERYRLLVSKASEVVTVSKGSYAPWKMLTRDYYMVDQLSLLDGDKLLALYNGDTSGGTFKTVRYAENRNKPIENCWQRWLNFNAVANV